MTEEQKEILREFMKTESCSIHICEECGKCKICNHSCEEIK